MSRPSFAIRIPGVVGTVFLCAAAATGCTGAGPAPPTVSVERDALPSTATTTTTTAAARLSSSASSESSATSPPRTDTTRARADDGRCGTVTAASGLTLRVLLGTGVTDCALGERVVAAFHAEIAGKQPAGSTRPAAAEVDGWHCVSGPPASGGGTDCESDGRNVQAAVEERE